MQREMVQGEFDAMQGISANSEFWGGNLYG